MTKPELASLDFTLNIILKNNANQNADNLAAQIKNLLQDSLDNIGVGGIIDIYTLIKDVQQMAGIAYAYINSIHIDDNPIIIKQ